MRPPEGYILYSEDRLVRRYRNDKWQRIYVGKRVPRDFELSRDEIRAYVNGGAPAACKVIMKNRSCKLKRALQILNANRGRDAKIWRAR